MPRTPTTRDLTKLKNFPWQYTVWVLLGVVSFLYAQLRYKDSQSEKTCNERIGLYQKAIIKKDSTATYWQSTCINLYNEILYKNNIIDRQQQLINNTDSIARRKLEKPAKQIVKGNE